MAKVGQTIEVRGLPPDIPVNRLTDKLYIHFLRKRNGGGEISSIEITKSGYALITFDDSKVANRVVQKGNHTLQLSDDQKYTLPVSWYRKKIDPDDLFLDIAVTVDYSKLPGGQTAIADLCRVFSDVKLTFHRQSEMCTLKGRYSEVQSLTKSLLSVLDSDNQKDFLIPNAEVSSGQKTYHPVSEEVKDPLKSEDLVVLSKYPYHTPEKSQLQLQSITNEKEKAEELKQTPSLEDFSMVIDSDIFRYLQSHCSTEYQGILNRHGVEVLDVSSHDITTLYLQIKAGAMVQSMQCMRSAHGELSRLYQEKEAQLRKEQISKDDLPKPGLQQNLDVLAQTYPKLSIHDEGPNISLVGIGSDLSEAKQFLLDSHGIRKKHCQKNIPNNALFQPFEAASFSFIRDRQCREERAEGSRKESKMDAGFTMPVAAESKSEELWSSAGERKARQDQQSPLFLPETHLRSDGKIFGDRPMSDIGHLRYNNSNQKEIVNSVPEDKIDFCKETEELSPISRKGKSFPKDLKDSTCSDSHSNPLHHVDLVGDSVSLSVSDRQGNSLEGSGQIRTKENYKVNHSGVNLVEKTPESKVASQKHDQISDTKDTFSMEVKVPLFLWLYIKHCYGMQIEDITADLQMREDNERKETILNLRGADSVKVRETQQRLKDLITKVSKDFSSNELSLSSIGISDHTSETLELKCAIVRRKYTSVLILPLFKNIFILGPKHDGLEAIAVLKELFLAGIEGEKSTDFCQGGVAADATGKDDIKLQKTPVSHSLGEQEAMQSLAVQDSSGAHKTPETERVSLETRSAPSQLETSPAAKEEKNIRAPSLAEDSTQRLVESGRNVLSGLNTDPNKPAGFDDAHNTHTNWGSKPIEVQGGGAALGPWCQGKVNPYCSVCPKSDTTDPLRCKGKNAAGSLSGDEQAQGAPKEPGQLCACGTPGGSIKACGAVSCSACEAKPHSERGVSPKAEERVPGIRGTMTCCEMSLSLPGHSRDTTLKITYTIPDGVQGKDHPNPGSAFQGGTFHAFLPLNEMTLQLSPSLKQAFDQGLTFCVRAEDAGDKVAWGHIPHKTSIEGGKSRYGYPDSGYLKCLKDSLKHLNVKEGYKKENK